jgi:hypothetical protein
MKWGAFPQRSRAVTERCQSNILQVPFFQGGMSAREENARTCISRRLARAAFICCECRPASDVDGIVKLYAPDAMFVGTSSKAVVVKPEGIRSYFENALLINRPRGATLNDYAAMVLSDTAVVITGLDTVTGVRDGQPFSANGRVTFVVAKRGSDWQIVHFHRSATPN